MKKKITTLTIGTLILFVWNAVSWMVLPFHSNSLKNIPESVVWPPINQTKIQRVKKKVSNCHTFVMRQNDRR